MITKIHKCGYTILFGFGTQTENPEGNELEIRSAVYHDKSVVWFKFEGVWYRTKYESLIEFLNLFKRCYTKNHVLDVITSII